MTAIIMGNRLKKLILCMTVVLSVAVFNLFQVTAVDVNKKCSLTLNQCLSGLNVHLYRVANITETGSYQYTEEFKDAENTTIDLNKLETSEDLKNAAITLKGYTAGVEGLTKQALSSQLCYTNLKTGLYLITADNLEKDNTTYTYLPYLISLPQGTNYDVSIDFIKYSKNPSHEYKIVKHWVDKGLTHPYKIEVELYEGSTLVKTITLDAENDYAYSWKTEKAMNYSIKEKSVKGYKGIVSSNSNETKTEFIITNTSIETPGIPVKTGDNTNINYWITCMAIAGLTLIVLGTIFRRKKIS